MNVRPMVHFVVTHQNKLVGMITVKTSLVVKKMSLLKSNDENPIAGSMKMSVASAGHRMIWEGLISYQ